MITASLHNAMYSLCRAKIVAGVVLGYLGLSGGAGTAVLDLTRYRPTFVEDFKNLSISAHGPRTTWTAHTPWFGDFGDARFDDPAPNGPFSITPEGLRITAKKGANQRWHSGLICSVDKDGDGQHGFKQQFGYFEMKARLPSEPGVWPAFWLIGADKKAGAAEIDVLEYYGVSDKYYHNVLHYFEDGRDTLSKDNMVTVTPGSLSKDFHTYGVLVEPATIRFFLDRVEVWRAATPKSFHQPMYVLANLALGGGWPIQIKESAVMDIAYIKVFQREDLKTSQSEAP